jgi:hypothetical protein
MRGMGSSASLALLPPITSTAPAGPTSAYPGHYPRRLLLRASSSPAASGWHLLRKVTGLTEGRWGFLRSPSPLVEPLGRRYPPGFVTVPTGQSYGCQRPLLYLLAPALQPLALVYNPDGSTTSLLSLPIGSCSASGPGEAPRSRRLSPLQPVENQSWGWGICGHLGT